MIDDIGNFYCLQMKFFKNPYQKFTNSTVLVIFENCQERRDIRLNFRWCKLVLFPEAQLIDEKKSGELGLCDAMFPGQLVPNGGKLLNSRPNWDKINE